MIETHTAIVVVKTRKLELQSVASVVLIAYSKTYQRLAPQSFFEMKLILNIFAFILAEWNF